MDEETKRLKLDGVGPRTPPQSDSEDEFTIEEIREKRMEAEKERKKNIKDKKKKYMNDFYKSLGELNLIPKLKKKLKPEQPNSVAIAAATGMISAMGRESGIRRTRLKSRS